jgi:hypothetical protein
VISGACGLPAVVDLRRERLEPAARWAREAAGDDQPDAAARALGVERRELAGSRRRVLEPVCIEPISTRLRQRGEAEVEWGEQVRVLAHRPSFVWWWAVGCWWDSAWEDLFEPLDLALFDANSAAQHQVLVQCAAAESAGCREVTLLDLAVDVEAFGVGVAVARDLRGDGRGVPERSAADLDGEFLGARGRVGGGQPARELGAAGLTDRVDLLVRLPGLFHQVDTDPAGFFHALEHAVDLLVGGAPEQTDRFLEPARELVARAGALGQ